MVALFVGPFAILAYACVKFNTNAIETVKNDYEAINFVITNADPLLSMFISLIYIFYFCQIVKLSCGFLSQACPDFVDIDKCKEDVKNLVYIIT